MSRSQWQRGLRRRSAATRLLRSCFRIPLGAWIFVCWECCVLSGRVLCDELITRPKESYRMMRRCVWSRNLKNEEAMARVGPQRHRKKYYERVFVPLVIQHAMFLRCIVFCDLTGSAVFFHIISYMAWFSRIVIEYEICVLIFSTIFVWNISHYEKNWAIYDHKCILVFM